MPLPTKWYITTLHKENVCHHVYTVCCNKSYFALQEYMSYLGFQSSNGILHQNFYFD